MEIQGHTFYMTSNEQERKANLSVISVGNLVNLKSLYGLQGEVVACFKRTFYVAISGQLICFTRSDLFQGPINIITSAPQSIFWSDLGVKEKGKVIITPKLIYLSSVIFNVSNAAIWAPKKPRLVAHNKVIKKRLKYLEGIKEKSGFESFIMFKASHNPIAALEEWLVSCLSTSKKSDKPIPCKVSRLLGLGPGLTPSGDDFLGGIMIALNLIGRRDICRRLWVFILNQPTYLTSKISWTYLNAASQGFSSVIHNQFLVSILSAEKNFNLGELQGFDQIGHTSGWDALLGSIKVLGIWVNLKKALGHS